MVRIVLKRDKTGHVVGYQVAGHAGFDEYGRDIVCAAVSVLAQATLIGLSRAAGIDIDYCIDREKGLLACRLPYLEGQQREKADLLLDTMRISLESLQRRYPDNISIVEEEV